MKMFKLIFLAIITILLNIINICDFSGKTIIFILMSIVLWIISIPDLKNTSISKKVVSSIFIILLLVIGYFSVNWKYWYPLQMWGDTSWLYIPIILFVASKAINSEFFIERENNIKLIISYIVTFIIVVGIISLIEKFTENIEADFLHIWLGMISSILFIYQLYKFLNIKIDLNMLNIGIVLIELIVIISVNLTQVQKITKYTNSIKNIDLLINSNELIYKNIRSEFNNQLVEYRETDEIRNKNFAFLSLGREWDYNVLISMYKSGIDNINKNNINSLINHFKETQYLRENYINVNKMFGTFIIINMLLSIFELIILIVFSRRKEDI